MNAPDRPDKFRRHRARKREQGLKQLRLWAYDPAAPGFAERAAAEIARINADHEAGDLDRWMEAVAVDLESMIEAEERQDRP